MLIMFDYEPVCWVLWYKNLFH